ncbi:MAG: helix-turn-helix domain-containing protein [Candidatus Thorarchaeota archaeon]
MSKSTTVKIPPVLTKNLGVSKNEVAVLLPIINGGNMTVGSISLISGLTYSVVEKALTSLEKKGLVKALDGVVSLYRLQSPILLFSESLSKSLVDVESLAETSKNALSSRIDDIDNTAESVIATQKSNSSKLNSFFEQYEQELLETVQNNMETVVGMAKTLLTGYSSNIEGVLNGLDIDLEESIGIQLTSLQTELDLSQTQLDKELKKILRQTKQVLKKETQSTTALISEIQKKSDGLLVTLDKRIAQHLQIATTHLSKGISSISGKLDALSLDASNKLSLVLTSTSEKIEQQSHQFDEDLGDYLDSNQESLDELFRAFREVSTKYVEQTETKIRTALESTEEFGKDIDSWQTEVTSYMNTASQTVIAQIDQIAGTDRAFLDVVKNILNGHLEKSTAVISDEYTTLKSLTRGISADTDTFMNAARSDLIKLLQKQVDADTIKQELTKDELYVGLESWGSKASKSIEKKTNRAIKEINSMLDKESEELTGLTVNMTSRLQSAFSTVKSGTSSKNEIVIGSIKKYAHEYETSLETKLSQVVSKYTSVTQKQVQGAKELYDVLSSHLNERLSGGVKKLNSEFMRVQKEIDGTISDQMSRIETHSSGIREEFHTHIEDITRQFISMTKGVEATFNGLLSSQTVEASDMIASAHTEFKNALKAESTALDIDSLKLQEEFASGIGMKIDTIVESVNALRRTLKEFTAEKQIEVSQSMESIITKIETTLNETEDSLTEVEVGTVKQLGDNLSQVAKEFNVSVSTASENISNKLITLHEDSDVILTKSSSGIKATVENYISDEQESKQRVVAATSTKIDSLAAKVVKSSDTKIQEVHTQLDESEGTFTSLVQLSRDAVMKTIEGRRNEAGLALDAASVWLESAVSNISGSLETFGTKMTNDMLHVQKSLSKAADETSTKLGESTNNSIIQLEEISKSFFTQTETILRTHARSIALGSKSTLDEGMDSLAELNEVIKLEAENTLKQVTSNVSQQIGESKTDVSERLSDYKRERSLIKDEFKNLLRTVTDHLTKSTAATLDDTKQGTVVANQFAARKFESIGLDLKASLSKSSYELIEKIRVDISTKSDEFTETLSQITNDFSESTGAIITSRVETIDGSFAESELQINEWASSGKTEFKTFQDGITKLLTETHDTVKTASETVNALHETIVQLPPSPSLDSWYLSGNEEACAHLLDMAQRAKESVIISVLTPDCLDIKKLAKVKNLQRQIIVLPKGEKLDSATPLPKSWRLWESDSPVFLGVMDDEEILIGGKEESEKPIFLVSRDKSYLKLFHDVLGPKIIQSRT